MPALLLEPAAGRRTVTHCYTLTYLRRENVTFIEPDMWPPNIRDLNPVDYAVWGALHQMVYQRRRFTIINQLKQAIVIEWGKLSQRFIDRVNGQCRRRLECVVQQQGGHIKKFDVKLHDVTVTLDNN